MSQRSVTHVHSILLQMVRQEFAVTSTAHKGNLEKEKSHVWEVRHAGLLGIKYEVAVRTDLFEADSAKKENDDVGEAGKEVLKGVIDAAVLGYVASAVLIRNCTRLIISSAGWVIEMMTFAPWRLHAYYPSLLTSWSKFPNL